MPNYQNGKIYTIRCKTDDNLIYVGSTTQRLCSRLSGHKADSSKTHLEYIQNHSLYSIIGDWGNWYIELYENFPCETREELNKREGEIIRLIGTLNKLIPGRTQKEYQDNNKDYSKQYYEQNKDYYKDYSKQYYEQNKDKIEEKYKLNVICDCGCTIQKGCFPRHLKSKKHAQMINSITKD